MIDANQSSIVSPDEILYHLLITEKQNLHTVLCMMTKHADEDGEKYTNHDPPPLLPVFSSIRETIRM